jgi:hypothetical protein
MLRRPTTYTFSLPEYEAALLKFVHNGVGRLMEAKDEVWASIPRRPPVEALPITQNTMPSGEVVEMRPMKIGFEFNFKFDSIIRCDSDELAAQMDRAADQNLAVIMPQFFKLVERTTDATGMTIDATGRPFSFELYLEGLEKVEIDFDKNGQPILPTLVMAPDLAEYIRSMPPITPDQQRALDALMDKKRKEHDANRRHRRLR